MQFFATLATLAIAAVGSATAVPSYASRSFSETNSGECNTGNIRCCNSVEPAGSDNSQMVLNALSLFVPTDTSVGMQCSPIDTSAVGGNPSW